MAASLFAKGGRNRPPWRKRRPPVIAPHKVSDTLELLGVNHRPSAGDATAAGRPCGRGSLGERARCGYAAEPRVSALVRVDARSGKALHRGEAGAVFEHTFVAVLDQRRGGQLWSRGQVGAVSEHRLVAGFGQRRGGHQQVAGVGQRSVSTEESPECIGARQRSAVS